MVRVKLSGGRKFTKTISSWAGNYWSTCPNDDQYCETKVKKKVCSHVKSLNSSEYFSAYLKTTFLFVLNTIRIGLRLGSPKRAVLLYGVWLVNHIRLFVKRSFQWLTPLPPGTLCIPRGKVKLGYVTCVWRSSPCTYNYKLVVSLEYNIGDAAANRHLPLFHSF